MGDKSIDCISNDSGDSWDILSNSGSEPERDFLSQPPSSCPIVCANCGDLLSDDFLPCLLCKNCYICAKCKANSPLAVHCKEVEAHSFIPTHESISPKDISNSENCESDILSLPETDNTPSVYEDFTDIDNWMKSSSNAQSFTLSDFDSNKDYVEVEPISSNPTTNNEYQEKKCTNQLSQNDGSILQVLLQFLQNTNQPIISTPESNLFTSKLLPVSTFESSLSKTSFHPHYATTVHNVLLNMDDSSAFQSWFNLSSSLGKKKKNTRHKEESFSSNSSTSSSSSLPYEPAVETLSPRHHDSFPLITTSSIVGITSGRFTISSSSSSSSSSPLTLTTSATRTRTTTTTPMTLKMQSSSSSSSVELTGDNSPNRSSSTSDFSSQSSSVCSLSSSSLGAATQFLKSVVKYSAAALNNFDLLSLNQTDDLPMGNWSKPFTIHNNSNPNHNSSLTKQNTSPSSPSSSSSSPSSPPHESLFLNKSIFKKSINTTHHGNENINPSVTGTIGSSLDNNHYHHNHNNSHHNNSPNIKRTVWDNEHLRDVISAKPLPSIINETIAYNLR